ncbi:MULTISPECIES: SpoIIE family protein phosphatase [unclassified Romboutsia]|uniref:SpoIIE family protein phosphatase n=1 Tax=unclassified Romboutsia TaxID=2626894 RepID=UPI00082065E3|nr:MULTISPECIES: SpoIIE family protein phosphatase [unclassified Romboutsia]SCH75064.1 Stage II sporulation protein E [uncultured Clostridium sp.]
MRFFIDFASGSLNKYKEELCGDRVEFYNGDDKFIAVMSDGLGSGVKANILATLTAKIALTMLKEGLDIEEVVDTIINTLPICKVRQVSYSTFTIISVDTNGIAYIAEFDNPSVFFLRNGDTRPINWNEKIIDNRKIRECKFELKENDLLVVVSDGAIYAGVGEILNLGWGWKDIAVYLRRFTNSGMSAKKVNNNLLGACNQLYMEKPGDDTTVMTIKAVSSNKAVLFSGPPIDKNKDREIVQEIMATHGKRIVCGGTAGNIVARELGVQVKTSFRFIDKDVPPIGYIDRIDLVTEGVLTLRKAIEKLNKIKSSNELSFIYKEDGASQLARILYEDCTHIKMIIGRAINPAHQNPDFPNELSIKLYLLNELKNILIELGKIVEVEYY